MKNLLVFFLSIMTTLACGVETSSPVIDPATGEFLGEVTVDVEDFRGCTLLDEEEGRCHPVDPVVCMTYGNGCYKPITCRLQVSANFEEYYSGYTKKVTAVRFERVIYNTTHDVCFTFDPDTYHNWELKSTSDPKIQCRPYVVGEDTWENETNGKIGLKTERGKRWLRRSIL